MFFKLKDYHNLLEKILEQKTFSSIAKSLLLSMIYKLEIAYRDYAKVNLNCVSKDVFFETILETVKNYCEHIKIVEPESSGAKLLMKNKVNSLTNTKERSILSYPTEIAMLEAISDIEPKYYFIQKDFGLKEVLQKLLVEGYKQNTVGILKNFNGWSWDVDSYEKMNFVAHILYQNIMMIKGEQFLYDWRTDNHGKKNYLSDLKRSLKGVTENEAYYETLCELLTMLKAKEEENNLQEKLIDLEKCFLTFWEEKLERISVREELVKMIYQVRLFQNLNFSEGKLVKDCRKLKKPFENLQRKLITKACQLGVLKIISMDIETNFEIYQFVFDTRLMDLEQIKMELRIEEENLLLGVYDKEIFEKQGKIKWNGNPKDVSVRKRKKINVFN